MKKIYSFLYICITSLALILIALNGSIIVYIEQQYHNFSEVKGRAGKILQTLYNAMPQDLYILNASRNLALKAESMRQNIFHFTNTQYVSEQDFIDSKEIAESKQEKKTLKETPKQEASEAELSILDYLNKFSDIYENAESSNHTKSLEPDFKNSNNEADSTHSKHKKHNKQTNKPPLNSQITQNLATQDSLTPQDFTHSLTPPQKIAESSAPTKHINKKIIDLSKGDGVLLIGDSMMEGTAPYILKGLKKMGLYGLNLSKHSTGLTYKSYFDWEEATKKALNNDTNIALLVVLLGANDPWTIKKTIAFKTPKWEEIYTQRIHDIIAAAQSKGVKIVWYEIPIVREKSLNDKIKYLNFLYQKSVKECGEVFLNSNAKIAPQGKYDAFIKDSSGKSKLIRDDDGVHFSSLGYKMMANILLEALSVQGE